MPVKEKFGKSTLRMKFNFCFGKINGGRAYSLEIVLNGFEGIWQIIKLCGELAAHVTEGGSLKKKYEFKRLHYSLR